MTIDASNPHVIWVGTGENVGGRHVGFGDGVYRSRDAGASWENLGLKDSQHISKIVVHPKKPDVVWVAAQGPLWSKGGDRGLFKTTDGGKTWVKVLGAGEWTGVTDIAIDPRNPDVLYAATWQRHRTVAAYMGGGPESGLHRSTDGGTTWEKLKKGLPEGSLGKIGLALSPQNPDVVYAAIEMNRREGAVYRSTDRGSSWEKRSETVSGATGPHYYQELYASPHAEGRLYLVDVRMQVSDDGGKTFRRMEEKDKHSDNHAVAFRKDDPEYLLVGTDGGIYESFDLAKTWRFVANLPVTQFYKVAVDDAAPFYTVYGGTQDNSTQGGPSRTDSTNGISNADWYITLFADGHQPATEPGNPSIMYSEWQQGNLVRVDRTTGERVYVQPQPEPADPPERFNWDAPILVSPHSPKRLYYASQRVWRSEDRGDSWRAVSGDLTRNQDRMTLPLMGRQWSWDSPWDMVAMSTFNTITSLAESPKAEGLLYAGTDDGLIQVSEDGGKSWRKVEVGSLPGVPASAFVNDLKADLHDADTVYAALDDHKSGDFRPYLLKSADRGRTWRSIAGDLPARHLVWRVVQDHVKPDLLFAGTEFGLFFTNDGGAPLGEARRRRADHRVPRPRHPAARERPRGRLLRPRLLRPRRLLGAARGHGGGAREGGVALPDPQGLVVRRARAARGERQGVAGRRLVHGEEPSLRRGLHLPPGRRHPEPREGAAGEGEAARRGGEGHAVPGLGRGRGGAPRGEARGRAHGEGRRRQRGAPRRGEGGEGLPPRGVGPAAALDPGDRLPLAARGGGRGRPDGRPRRSRRLHGLAGEAGGRSHDRARRPGALRGRPDAAGRAPGADPQQTAAFLRAGGAGERATTAATQAVRQAQERVEGARHRARALALGARTGSTPSSTRSAGALRDRRGARREPRPGHGRGRRRRHDLAARAGGGDGRRLVHLRPDADAPAQPRDRGAGVRRRCASASTRCSSSACRPSSRSSSRPARPGRRDRPVPPLP